MCYGCWKDKYGKPEIVNELTVSAAKEIEKVYSYNCGGGDAHIVIDDWNLSDENIEWCIENAKDEDIEARESALYCLRILREMTIDERASALAIHDGFVKA